MTVICGSYPTGENRNDRQQRYRDRDRQQGHSRRLSAVISVEARHRDRDKRIRRQRYDPRAVWHLDA